ncbi:hypothetical protein H6F67_00640 [Microcoleus sp. FACHB-1515]|nr:hypothetical protein [Microcoleus sp. FACHB-1515]
MRVVISGTIAAIALALPKLLQNISGSIKNLTEQSGLRYGQKVGSC